MKKESSNTSELKDNNGRVENLYLFWLNGNRCIYRFNKANINKWFADTLCYCIDSSCDGFIHKSEDDDTFEVTTPYTIAYEFHSHNFDKTYFKLFEHKKNDKIVKWW